MSKVATLALLFFAGCAQQPLVAPSTARSQTAVANARRANAQASRYNDVNMTTGQRIEAKSKVIEKYWQ